MIPVAKIQNFPVCEGAHPLRHPLCTQVCSWHWRATKSYPPVSKKDLRPCYKGATWHHIHSRSRVKSRESVSKYIIPFQLNAAHAFVGLSLLVHSFIKIPRLSVTGGKWQTGWVFDRFGDNLQHSSPWKYLESTFKTTAQSSLLCSLYAFNCKMTTDWDHYYMCWVLTLIIISCLLHANKWFSLYPIMHYSRGCCKTKVMSNPSYNSAWWDN